MSGRQHWSILTFDVRTIQKFYMKEISFMDLPQHGEVFYFYGQALVKDYLTRIERDDELLERSMYMCTVVG
jgi:hypothetical protein